MMLPFMRVTVKDGDVEKKARIQPAEIESFADAPIEGQCWVQMKSGHNFFALYTAEIMEGMIANYNFQIQEMVQKAQTMQKLSLT
jgi:hypothetical protein